MGQDEGQVGAPVANEQKTPDEIRHEIEDSREDLGDTAAALASKTDVKARAREKAESIKQTMAEKRASIRSQSGDAGSGGSAEKASAAVARAKAKAQENPVPTAVIAAFLGGFLLGRITSQ
jgi:ElaB/YqjD/DUF883 family membrane-anchored ribosome-binding protein